MQSYIALLCASRVHVLRAGVEMGGALKNVLAIACGISDGLGFGNNGRAALITRGLAEMTRLVPALIRLFSRCSICSWKVSHLDILPSSSFNDFHT